MTDDIKAIRDALQAGPTPGPWEIDESADVGFDIRSEPREWLVIGSSGAELRADAAYIAACHPERIARMLDALEQAQKDAERWQWLVRHASLGFEGAPSWNAVVRLPVFNAEDQHIAALVDRAMKGQA